MEVVKKNLISIICGVVAIAAICALLVYPVPKMTGELTNDLTNSKKNYADKIDTLMKAKRVYPPIPDMNNPNAEPVALPIFPTKDVIGKGEEFRLAVTQQSQKM